MARASQHRAAREGCGRSDLAMRHWKILAWIGFAAVGCVPGGSAGPSDAGTANRGPSSSNSAQGTPMSGLGELLKSPFRDDFDRPNAPSGDGSSSGGTELGPDWMASAPNIWHIESGRVCGEHARNHGLWLKKAIPVNARIEFDAVSMSTDGDVKAEFWGDGRSAATSISYTNATSYLAISGDGTTTSTCWRASTNTGATAKKSPSSRTPKIRSRSPLWLVNGITSRSNEATAATSSGGSTALRC